MSSPKVRVVGVRMYGADGRRSWLYEAVVPIGGKLVERHLCRSWRDAMDRACTVAETSALVARSTVLHSGDVATWATHVNLTNSAIGRA